jgi:aspartyl-tRNA(Asn)/glutamyl-tRNA(Gln) amidotransferase subunit A
VTHALSPVAGLVRALSEGIVTTRALIEDCLQRIADTRGEGARAFVTVHAGRARAEADEIDRRRRSGTALPPLAGLPISVKDLFDERGVVTTAGSIVLREHAPAAADAPAIARLRAAGCVIVGRTSMTEFAFSGLGLNPHYGTPRNPYDRATGRIPGGSSSGAAVAVCDEFCAVSIGTDTGGSCRIPAALCGITGFKPTAQRVSREGSIPLSTTLDSVGPLARTVEDCALLDAVMAGGAPEAPAARVLSGLQLWVPTTLVLDGLDAAVASAFERALASLSRAGVQIVHEPLPAFSRLPELNSRGGIAAYEAYAWHCEMLETRGAEYDPRVATRIRKGKDISDADHGALLEARARMMTEVSARSRSFAAMAFPTVPIIAPRLDEFATDERYLALNAQVLRNAAIANFLDRCAISLPIHAAGGAPVGLMLMGEHGSDRALLALARAIEAALV